jgi:lipopolysaccharide transport system permease protein
MLNIFLKKDFWELFWVFTWREIKIKYAQTYIGIFWMLFPPLMAIIIASFFFGKLMRVSSEIPNYTLFAYCGMMGWYYFSYLISFTSVSLIQNIDLVHKTNIPRIVIPLAKAMVGMFDIFLWILIALILKLLYNLPFNVSTIFIFGVVFLNFIAGFSVGIWIAIFSIRWRDIYQIIPYIIGFTVLATPVLYHLNMVPDSVKFILYFNPVAGVIELYRTYIVNTGENIIMFLPGFIMAFVLIFLGLYIFFKQEKKLAETI